MATAWIGTYTHFNGKPTGSRGIYRVTVTPEGFSDAALVAEAANPTYLGLSGDGRYLFAALETEEMNEAGQSIFGGGVASYAITGDALSCLGVQSAGSRGTCHVSEHDGHVVAANYTDGTVSIFRHEDGRLSPRTALLVHSGEGPDSSRQAGAHAHFAHMSPWGELCVADLGIDKIMRYAPGSWAFRGYAAMAPGSGPRHLAFAGKLACAIGEMSSTVEVFTASGATWQQKQTLPTLPEGFAGASTCAAVRLSPDGRFLVVSNRGHDSLAVFSIADEALTPVGIFPCGGREPRDFAFTPDGGFIVCGLQYDDQLALLSFDASTGNIADTQRRIDVPMPVCIAFHA